MYLIDSQEIMAAKIIKNYQIQNYNLYSGLKSFDIIVNIT